jgi:L-ascorbate metabolism protein UlaG (beta-lactamase superfamily)
VSSARVQLVRHATLLVELGGARFLIDPMLDEPGVRPPIENTPGQRPNPLVPLAIPAHELVQGVDAVLVSHLHQDHFDLAAQQALPRDSTLICQPEDSAELSRRGQWKVVPVEDEVECAGVRIHRTGGRHGSGELAQRMGPVSGFVLMAGSARVYVAGDTVWCPPVAEAIERFRPRLVVVNAGAARFLQGDPITMDVGDVAAVARAADDSTVVAVHMEAINHCLLTRDELRDALSQDGLEVAIPEDGQAVELA